MARSVLIADSHLGADPMGYQMQPAYPERLDEIVAALDAWIRRRGDVDFVLHAGDVVDAATDANIRHAADLFDLSVPVTVCLGNHDLTVTNAIERWWALAPEFFGQAGGSSNSPTYSFAANRCEVHVAPNHWCCDDYFWDEQLTPQFRPRQIEQVTASAAAQAAACQILVTHSPAIGVPTELTGLDETFHGPPEAFTTQVSQLVADCGIQLVLGAHSHVNMRANCGGADAVTVSAPVEAPFEFKLIEAHPHHLRVETFSLADHLSSPPELDPARLWTLARPIDRTFERTF